jgi:hypothetical protein
VSSFGIAFVLEPSTEVRDVLPDSVIEWPVLGAQHANAGDSLWRLPIGGERRGEDQH